MKKKKALLALIVVAIVASIGALGYLALSYFSSSAEAPTGRRAVHRLSSEKTSWRKTRSPDSSKNIFSGSKNGLRDKQEEVTLQPRAVLPTRRAA